MATTQALKEESFYLAYTNFGFRPCANVKTLCSSSSHPRSPLPSLPGSSKKKKNFLSLFLAVPSFFPQKELHWCHQNLSALKTLSPPSPVAKKYNDPAQSIAQAILRQIGEDKDFPVNMNTLTSLIKTICQAKISEPKKNVYIIKFSAKRKQGIETVLSQDIRQLGTVLTLSSNLLHSDTFMSKKTKERAQQRSSPKTA